MAHRKLQQEIDRVFKKINEGLEIFNTFHERHENAMNTSQKDKLENDLKREIKKLQKLREQIKVWQTSNDVKDKEKLLEYRRLVEVAMEKYKVIEKGSKVKAYSNMSLKQAAELDPEEQEKVDTINFIQDSIDEIERQFQTVEVEIEKISSKKSKKNAAANDAKKEELKELQGKYRWHQQNLELALRLLENDELVVADIQEIKEDLEYFISNNRDDNFIDNEYIYESLDLDSNEMIQHELVTSFNGITEVKEQSPQPEQQPSQSATPTPTPISTSTTTNTTSTKQQPSTSSALPTPTKEPVIPQSSSTTSTPSKPIKKFTTLNTTISQSSLHTISSSQPGTPTVIGASSSSSLTDTLKPAVIPAKPIEMKWSSLAASGLSNGNNSDHVKSNQNSSSTSSSTATATITTTTTTTTTTTINAASASVQSGAGSNTLGSGSVISRDGSHNGVVGGQPKLGDVNSIPLQNLQISNNGVIQNSSVGGFELKKEDSPVVVSNLDDSNYLNDEELISLPPGIQDIILSFYSKRVSTEIKQKNTISNISDYLTVPRYYLKEGYIPQQSCNENGKGLLNNRGLTNEFQRCFTGWNKVRLLFNNSSNNETFLKISQELDIGILFYGFYFSLSPIENKLILNELIRRNWKSDKFQRNWFQKSNNQPIVDDENKGFEISNFNKFDSVNWTLTELNNFKLDFSQLS